jgi:hypothetical protein
MFVSPEPQKSASAQPNRRNTGHGSTRRKRRRTAQGRVNSSSGSERAGLYERLDTAKLELTVDMERQRLDFARELGVPWIRRTWSLRGSAQISSPSRPRWARGCTRPRSGSEVALDPTGSSRSEARPLDTKEQGPRMWNRRAPVDRSYSHPVHHQRASASLHHHVVLDQGKTCTRLILYFDLLDWRLGRGHHRQFSDWHKHRMMSLCFCMLGHYAIWVASSNLLLTQHVEQYHRNPKSSFYWFHCTSCSELWREFCAAEQLKLEKILFIAHLTWRW